MKPLVSVLMTTYNHEKYIIESVNSVLQQSYSNFEIVLVNDGSTDNTQNLLKTFKDDRLKIYNQPNSGVSVAINNALKAVNGNYILLFSGDDVLLPTAIETAMSHLLATKSDIVFSVPNFINENGELFVPKINPFSLKFEPSNPTVLFNALFYQGNFFCAPSCMSKAEVLKSLSFNVALLQLQDFEIWVELCKQRYRFSVNKIPTINYRVREKGMNLSSSKNIRRIQFETYALYKQFFSRCSLDLITEAFANELRNINDLNKKSPDLIKAHLYLTHSNPIVKLIGLEFFYERARNDISFNELEQFGIDSRTFFSLSSEIPFFHAEHMTISQRIIRLVKRAHVTFK